MDSRRTMTHTPYPHDRQPELSLFGSILSLEE